MTRLRRRLARGLGLRARMTASYVLVTFAAVLLVEALAAVLVIPNVTEQADLTSRVVNTASQYMKEYGGVLDKAPHISSTPGAFIAQVLREQQLGDAGVRPRPGEVRTQDQGVLIPHVTGLLPDSAPMSLVLVLDPRGLIYGSSYEGRYPPGQQAGPMLPRGWNEGRSAVSSLAHGSVAWSSEPVVPDPLTLAPTGTGAKRAGVLKKLAPLGFVYVQVPVPAG